MAKFSKEILKPGLFIVNDGKGGRRAEHITEERLRHWAEQHKKMREAGLNIPAPALHDKSKPVSDRASFSSKDNFGFWEEVTFNQKTNSKTNQPYWALDGIVDVPVDSDAERVGKSVKETSIFAMPKFVDGTGKEWNDVLCHIALVTNPIEPGQSNFNQVADDGALQVAMSSFVPIEMSQEELSNIMQDVDSSPTTGDLYTLLEQVAGISVDRGTPPDQLPKALVAALKQKQLSESRQDGGSLTKPPKDSQLHEVPIIMSQNQQTKPTEQTPPAVVDPKVEEVSKRNEVLMSMFTNQKKQNLHTKLSSLARRGLVDEAQIKSYQEQINQLEMSFDSSGKETLSPVEIALDTLASVKIKPPTNKPMTAMAQADDDGNYVIQPHSLPASNPYGPSDVTDERAEEIVNGLMGTIDRN